MFLGYRIFHRKKENVPRLNVPRLRPCQKDIVGIFFHARVRGNAYDSGQFQSLGYGREGGVRHNVNPKNDLKYILGSPHLKSQGITLHLTLHGDLRQGLCQSG